MRTQQATPEPKRPARELLPVVVVFDVPNGDATATARLKRFLKNALRAYSLRCVELREPTQAELIEARPDFVREGGDRRF